MADTGSTYHFSTTGTPYINKCMVPPSSITILLPNGRTMHSTHEAELDIPYLPSAARKAHIFPSLAAGPLISVGQLCDSGCSTAIFTAPNVSIKQAGQIILAGTRLPVRQLWSIGLPRKLATTNQSNQNNLPPPASPMPSKPANPPQLITFFAHAAIFSPYFLRCLQLWTNICLRLSRFNSSLNPQASAGWLFLLSVLFRSFAILNYY
jgi:hypothetical protein